jgi:hypothetical protein
MDVLINYELRNSGTLKRTVDKNRAAMDAAGFEEAVYIAFTGAIDNLSVKVTAQKKAVNALGDLTEEQNRYVRKVHRLIREVKAAAKSAYGKSKKELKMFYVGESIPLSTKNLIPVCNYFVELIADRKTILMKNGLKQAKIDALTAVPGELIAIDELQEISKKTQQSLTLERDLELKALKELEFKIRNFAIACFSDQPEILIQFDPIPRGRGKSVGDDEQPKDPSSPENADNPKE